MNAEVLIQPEKDKYCNVQYDGRDCIAKVISVDDKSNTFDVETTFGALMHNIPFDKYRHNELYAFELAARPLIKYLAENHHPHMTAIITNTTAELMEGKMSLGHILDYID